MCMVMPFIEIKNIQERTNLGDELGNIAEFNLRILIFNDCILLK